MVIVCLVIPCSRHIYFTFIKLFIVSYISCVCTETNEATLMTSVAQQQQLFEIQCELNQLDITDSILLELHRYAMTSKDRYEIDNCVERFIQGMANQNLVLRSSSLPSSSASSTSPSFRLLLNRLYQRHNTVMETESSACYNKLLSELIEKRIIKNRPDEILAVRTQIYNIINSPIRWNAEHISLRYTDVRVSLHPGATVTNQHIKVDWVVAIDVDSDRKSDDSTETPTSTRRSSSLTFDISDTRTQYHLERGVTIHQLARALIRYKSLVSGGQQWGPTQDLLNDMHKWLGVRIEAFASPFNTRLAKYPDCSFGSLCVETDACFGSIGDFMSMDLSALPENKHVYINPWFGEHFIADAVSKVLQDFENKRFPSVMSAPPTVTPTSSSSSSSSSTSSSSSKTSSHSTTSTHAYVYVPEWKDSVFYRQLTTSRFYVDHCSFQKGRYRVERPDGSQIPAYFNCMLVALDSSQPPKEESTVALSSVESKSSITSTCRGIDVETFRRVCARAGGFCNRSTTTTTTTATTHNKRQRDNQSNRRHDEQDNNSSKRARW